MSLPVWVLPPVLLQYSDRAAREAQTGSVGETQENVVRFCSSSSCGETIRPRDPDAEIRDLRAQVEQLMRLQKVDKRQGVQGELERGEGGLDEDWKMFKKKLNVRRGWMSREKSCRNNCGRLTSSRIWIRFYRRDIRKNGRNICKRLSRSGMISCRDHKKNKKVSIVAKFAKQKEEVSQGRLCLR